MGASQEAGDEVTEAEADWNEEFDAWFELIEDHLKSIGLWIRILVVVLVILIAVLLLTWMFPELSYTSPFLRQFRLPWLGFD